MMRMFSTVAIAALIAGPATAAEQVRVNMFGKSDQAIQAEIHKAAQRACRGSVMEDGRTDLHAMPDCIADAEARAMSQARVYEATRESPNSLASISTTAKPGR